VLQNNKTEKDMTQETFLFYDIETTGLNKCFDQVLQFAAIRTDLELNELSRHEIIIKLRPDVTPSPYAVITHHIGLKEMQEGEHEYEAIQQIHKLLNQPGTLSLGYNTLGFDDEFLRFAFYRNLLPPYTHQYASRCGRLDIYPITVLYYLFKNKALKWPYRDEKISLKLEMISAENNLMQGAAHNAMVDVEATLNLAQLLKKESKMWHYACGYFNKKTDIQRGDALPILLETEHTLFRHGLIINGKAGAKNNFMLPVISLGQHKHYKNQTLWLRLDDENLLTLNSDNISEKTRVTRKKMGEQELLLPPEERYLAHLDEQRQQLMQKTIKHLLNNPKLLHDICNYHQHYKYPEITNIDIDAALYTQGFPTAAEEKLYREFHKAEPKDKLNIARQFPNTARFEQALRIMGRHYPEYLDEDNQHEFDDYLTSKLTDYRNQEKLMRADLSLQRDELYKQTLTEKQKKLLDELII